MTEATIVHHMNVALSLILLLSMPTLLIASVVGLVVGLLQAVTPGARRQHTDRFIVSINRKETNPIFSDNWACPRIFAVYLSGCVIRALTRRPRISISSGSSVLIALRK